MAKHVFLIRLHGRTHQTRGGAPRTNLEAKLWDGHKSSLEEVVREWKVFSLVGAETAAEIPDKILNKLGKKGNTKSIIS